jgi:hypothetical protein
MKNVQLRSLLKRVERWPKGAQQEAIQVLPGIEGDFFAGLVTMAELDHAHQEALRDRGVSLEDLRQRFGA